MRLVYQVNTDNNLKDLLGMVYEIYAEMGLVPIRIVLDDRRSVTFDLEDWKRLNRGDISDEEYIARHLVNQ